MAFEAVDAGGGEMFPQHPKVGEFETLKGKMLAAARSWPRWRVWPRTTLARSPMQCPVPPGLPKSLSPPV